MPTWKAGNIGINWQPTLKRSDGTVIDITGKAIKLQIQNTTDGITDEVTGSIINGTGGVCSFLLDGVIDVVGEYTAEIQISASGYKEDSFSFPWIVQLQVKT